MKTLLAVLAVACGSPPEPRSVSAPQQAGALTLGPRDHGKHVPIEDRDDAPAPIELTAPATGRVWLAPAKVPWPTWSRAEFARLGAGTKWSVAIGVSADGTTVVGFAQPTGGLEEAVRWRAGTMQPLRTLDLDGDDRSYAYAVSANGDVIVGESGGSKVSAFAVAWIRDEPPVTLASPANMFHTSARAISADGSVIAGFGLGTCESQCGVQWRRRAADALIDGRKPLAMASISMSADAASIVGATADNLAGMRITTRKVEHFATHTADAISGDGNVIAGHDNGKPILLRGTKRIEMGMLEGYEMCWPRALSADGSRATGNCTRQSGTPQSAAFVWDAKHGMRSVQDVLVAAGVDLSGWSLDEAFSICARGVTIVGNGDSGAAREEAWISVIPR